jgi:hypothetical protein
MAVTETPRRYRDPSWWNRDYDSGWERTKAAFRRDWEQTKHDFGGKTPDLKQDVDDTVKQAAGKQSIPPPYQPNYEDFEPAYRFGFGARRHYGSTYPAWDDQLETQLRSDWMATYPDAEYDWNRYRSHIRRGWDYNGNLE